LPQLLEKDKELSVFGKGFERERELVNQIFEDLSEAYARTYLPFVVIDKEEVKRRILRAREKMGELLES